MILAATGHRPPNLFKENFYSFENKKLLVIFAVQEISALKEKPEKIISGGANGWDQAIGWGALKLKIPLEVALPFPNMDSKWPLESREEFSKMLRMAQKVTILDQVYSNAAYYKRDKYMVDNCDVLLALHNGSTEGGTAITVQYANQVNRKIINVWDNWTKYNDS